MPQRSRAARRRLSDRADIIARVAAMTGGDLEPVNGAGGHSSGIITQTDHDTGVAYRIWKTAEVKLPRPKG